MLITLYQLLTMNIKSSLSLFYNSPNLPPTHLLVLPSYFPEKKYSRKDQYTCTWMLLKLQAKLHFIILCHVISSDIKSSVKIQIYTKVKTITKVYGNLPFLLLGWWGIPVFLQCLYSLIPFCAFLQNDQLKRYRWQLH